MALEPLDTAHGAGYPGCRQLSVFFENRVGQLLRLTRLFEGQDVHILGISVNDSIDCSVVRIMVDEPDEAEPLLTSAGFCVSSSDLVVVELPPGKRGILTLCQALIRGEVNIQYLYPLIATSTRPSCLAVHVDNLDAAYTTLSRSKFNVLHQHEL